MTVCTILLRVDSRSQPLNSALSTRGKSRGDRLGIGQEKRKIMIIIIIIYLHLSKSYLSLSFI